jgi:hypothetical protein
MSIRRAPPFLLTLLITLGLAASPARADDSATAELVKVNRPVHQARPVRIALSTLVGFDGLTDPEVAPGVMITARVLSHVDVEATLHPTLSILGVMADAGMRLRAGEGSRVGFLYARAGAAALAISCGEGNPDCGVRSVFPYGSIGLGGELADRDGWSLGAQGGLVSELTDWQPGLQIQLSAGRRF